MTGALFNAKMVNFGAALSKTALATGFAMSLATNFVVTHAAFAAEPTITTAIFEESLSRFSTTFGFDWALAAAANTNRKEQTAIMRKNGLFIVIRVGTRVGRGERPGTGYDPLYGVFPRIERIFSTRVPSAITIDHYVAARFSDW